MTTANLMKRLQTLESQIQHKRIVFKMPNGTFKTLPHKDFLEICGQTICGIVSPQTDIIRNAISCNETGRLLELACMCIN
jgi:hypothetical protein